VSNVDVLVVAPHAPELEGLGSLLGRDLFANVQGVDVVAKSVGLGLPGVAGGTTQRLERLHPRAVVLLSTCAAYPGRGIAPGQVVVAERLVITDAAVLKGWANFPDPMVGQIQTHSGMVSGLTTAGTHRVSVACPCSITADVRLAADIVTQLGCDVEQSEAFGIALACAPYRVPFTAVLGVSYEVGPSARETWRVTHRSAAQAAAALVTAWLRAGAVGVPHGVPQGSPASNC
jgi:nucleoside phosphorylase